MEILKLIARLFPELYSLSSITITYETLVVERKFNKTLHYTRWTNHNLLAKQSLHSLSEQINGCHPDYN